MAMRDGRPSTILKKQVSARRKRGWLIRMGLGELFVETIDMDT
jgi:hypothetical protein